MQSRHPWKIVLADIDVEETRELWVEELHYLGDARIRGNLAYQIRGELEVEDASVELRSGVLKIGERAVGEGVEARLAGSLEPFAPGLVRAAETFERFTGTLDVRSPVRSLAFVDLFLRRAPWLVIDGEGELEAHLAVERGRLQPASRLVLGSGRIEARFPHYEARGAGTLEGHVAPHPDGSAEVAVHFQEVAIARQGGRAFAEGEAFDIRATVHDPVLGTGFHDLDLAFDLSDSRLSNFDSFNFYLPPGSGLTIRSGSGTLRGRLEMRAATRSGRGELDLAGKAVEMQFEDLRIRGDLHLEGRLSETASPEPGTDDSYSFEVGGSRLELSRVRISGAPSRRAGDWWATLQLEKGTVRFAEPLGLEATLRAEMRDSQPLVAIFAEKNRLVRWFDGLLTVEDVHLAADVELGEAIDLRRLRMTGRNLELLARLRLANHAPQGILFAKVGRLAAGVELKNGRRDWKLLDARAWFERRAKELPSAP